MLPVKKATDRLFQATGGFFVIRENRCETHIICPFVSDGVSWPIACDVCAFSFFFFVS